MLAEAPARATPRSARNSVDISRMVTVSMSENLQRGCRFMPRSKIKIRPRPYGERRISASFSFAGVALTRATRSPAADRPSCRTTALSKSSCPSMMATMRPSPHAANDFFNSLLGIPKVSRGMICGDMPLERYGAEMTALDWRVWLCDGREHRNSLSRWYGGAEHCRRRKRSCRGCIVDRDLLVAWRSRDCICWKLANYSAAAYMREAWIAQPSLQKSTRSSPCAV